jgi:hypothetical protein
LFVPDDDGDETVGRGNDRQREDGAKVNGCPRRTRVGGSPENSTLLFFRPADRDDD